MKTLIGGLLTLGTLFFATGAIAGCTGTPRNASLGTASSFIVESASSTTQISAGITCTTLNGNQGQPTQYNNMIDAKIQLGSNANGTKNRLYNAEKSTYLPYSICKEANCSNELNSTSATRWSNNVLVDLLREFTGENKPALYIRTDAGTHLPSGVYTDILNINWAWDLCDPHRLGVPKCDTEKGSITNTITLTFVIEDDCMINLAPDLDFGSAALVSAFKPVMQTIQITCTPDATYQVGFDMGRNASDGWRNMVNGSNKLQYNITKPTDNSVWNTTLNTESFTATGKQQDTTYYAAINPLQNNVPAGTYTDTVSVIVTY